MKSIKVNSFNLSLSLEYFKEDTWHKLQCEGEMWYSNLDKELQVKLILSEAGDYWYYKIEFLSIFETQIRMKISLIDEEDLFHLIPCNIHGSNNFEIVRPEEFPLLTTQRPTDIDCSDFWEFRADRASHPVSMLCCKNGVVGMSISPYDEESGKLIRNGVFSQLPNIFGCSLGYTNDPVTFINHTNFETFKMDWSPSTFDRAKKISACGKIYGFRGNGRQEAHTIIRDIYEDTRVIPSYSKTYREAAQGLLDSFMQVNWSQKYQNYTNQSCKVPAEPTLVPWRPLVEIGWTGGGVLAYPFLAAQYGLQLSSEYFKDRKNSKGIMDEIINGYNEKSGLLYDVTKPWSENWPNSRLSGWWAGFHLAEECHCAYTNGSALYCLFKMLDFMQKHMNETNHAWLETGLKVLDTIVALQREDGAFGYAYCAAEKKVLDWDGFAGCWFISPLIYAFRHTTNEKYLNSAKKALAFYSTFVYDLNCWGTPMDTWKSVDEEGNLAFIKASRLMHETTGEERYLDMLKAGAGYEYLWRYGFKAKPQYPPLKDCGWNSCGGSVTSVSNPHIHPMGLLVTDDLEYLSKKTGDAYHQKRADDAIAWIMATLELYPDITGYGQYGVLSERFCPSDGLTIEKYSDESPSSTWFSYNGWAAANALEAIAERLIKEDA